MSRPVPNARNTRPSALDSHTIKRTGQPEAEESQLEKLINEKNSIQQTLKANLDPHRERQLRKRLSLVDQKIDKISGQQQLF